MFTDRYGLEIDGSMDSALPYFPNRDEHSNRNRNNQCPLKEPSENQCSKNDFQKDQNDGLASAVNGGVLKHRSPKGYECQYDDGGNLLPDKNANYTHNYTAGTDTFLDLVPTWLARCSSSFHLWW